ncbi:MAG: hypothetical protein ABIO44_08245 [Saprospiraceae bacterium]
MLRFEIQDFLKLECNNSESIFFGLKFLYSIYYGEKYYFLLIDSKIEFEIEIQLKELIINSDKLTCNIYIHNLKTNKTSSICDYFKRKNNINYLLENYQGANNVEKFKEFIQTYNKKEIINEFKLILQGNKAIDT